MTNNSSNYHRQQKLPKLNTEMPIPSMCFVNNLTSSTWAQESH